MSHREDTEQVFRTSPQRTARMMAIMLGICIVGGIIFFSMWGYWISGTSPAAHLGEKQAEAVAAFTGKEIPVSLKFIESSDFRTLSFNALPGDPDHNPTVKAEVGDKIVFNVENGGKSFHAFGVTKEAEGFSGIIPGSNIRSASNPLKPGEGGQSEFIPPGEGTYYYICTVPGHRQQGMEGKIIVGNISEETNTEKMVPEPESEPVTGSTMPVPGSEEVPEMIVKEEPELTTPFTGTISIPTGSSAPGCDETKSCFSPTEVSVKVGDTVTWKNNDSAAHTVTSGSQSEGPDGNFDSSLFMSGTTFSHTFDKPGEYNYFCMVHPWMTGKVKVN